jgi:hypothetical protein
VNRKLFLMKINGIQPCIYMVFNDDMIESIQLDVRLGKNIKKILEKRFISDNIFRRTIFPKKDMFLNTKNNEILTLMVGEILVKFPSSNALGDGMGFLKKSNFPWGENIQLL